MFRIIALERVINMPKDKVNKTRSNKKYRYTAEEVAGICNLSVDYVKSIRQQRVPLESENARRVMAVDRVLYTESSKLLAEVERIIGTNK